VRFLLPPDEAFLCFTRCQVSLAGAIAPAKSLHWHQDQPGAKAPGQRPPRPWRALLARRVGRWPLSLPDRPVCRTPSRAGGGNAMRFLVPPEQAKRPSTRQWQGPSPLPHHNAASCPAGGQSPRPAPAPPPAGASPPPGRALACVPPGPAGLRGTVPRGQGKRGSRFLIPPGEAFSRMPGHSGKGHRLCHSATLPLVQPGDQGPRPVSAPPPAGASPPPGRALTSVSPGPTGLQGTVARGRGKRGSRFLFPPEEAFLCIPRCPDSLAGAIAPATALR